MTAKQFHELEAFYEIEPFGELRSELRHGQIMALTLNLNRDPKTRSEPFSSLECMNFVEQEPEPILTPEEIELYIDRMLGC